MSRDNGKLTDVGGLKLDPAVLDELRQDAVTNRAALTDKQRRDRGRCSLRIDCPRWLKTEITADAEKNDISISQWARFLLLWATIRYRRGDLDLVEAIDQARHEIRSLNARYGLSLEDLEEAVADSAESLPV